MHEDVRDRHEDEEVKSVDNDLEDCGSAAEDPFSVKKDDLPLPTFSPVVRTSLQSNESSAVFPMVSER